MVVFPIFSFSVILVLCRVQTLLGHMYSPGGAASLSLIGLVRGVVGA